jgi:hypothetical protein
VDGWWLIAEIGMKLTEIGMIFDLNGGPIQSDSVRCGTGHRGEDITKDYLRLPKVTQLPKGSGTLPFLYQNNGGVVKGRLIRLRLTSARRVVD